jgi:hypothetical protein
MKKYCSFFTKEAANSMRRTSSLGCVFICPVVLLTMLTVCHNHFVYYHLVIFSAFNFSIVIFRIVILSAAPSSK